MEHTYPVVNQVDVRQRGVARSDRAAQRSVEGVHRSITLGTGHDALIFHEHFDSGFRRSNQRVVGDDPVRLEVKETLFPSSRIAEQQLERSIRHLEVIALVFESLPRVEDDPIASESSSRPSSAALK